MEDTNLDILAKLLPVDKKLFDKLNNKQNKSQSVLNLPLTRIAEVDTYHSNVDLNATPIQINIIGAGGTGGYLVRDLSRFVYSIEKRTSKSNISITIFDGDNVEEKNILRQNFLPHDIGQNKAEVLALRHVRAFGTNINYVPEMFESVHASSQKWRGFNNSEKGTIIYVGCVDNNAARREIAKTMENFRTENWGRQSQEIWWIDSGNERKTGQVIAGSNYLMDVTDFYPEILLPEYDSKEVISCADRMMEDEQNMFVNLTASNLILNYLRKIILNEPMITNGSVFNIDNRVDNYYILKDNKG